jgi:hypothetical protein
VQARSPSVPTRASCGCGTPFRPRPSRRRTSAWPGVTWWFSPATRRGTAFRGPQTSWHPAMPAFWPCRPCSSRDVSPRCSARCPGCRAILGSSWRRPTGRPAVARPSGGLLRRVLGGRRPLGDRGRRRRRAWCPRGRGDGAASQRDPPPARAPAGLRCGRGDVGGLAAQLTRQTLTGPELLVESVADAMLQHPQASDDVCLLCLVRRS